MLPDRTEQIGNKTGEINMMIPRTRLQDRMLPDYTHGEEMFNMTSHIVGGGIGVAVTALCVVFAALHHDAYAMVSGAVYGIAMMLLYAMSSIYHGLNPNLRAKKVLQVIDHCSIFVLIAGTCTPLALCTMRRYSPVLGWTVFGVMWGIAALGITLNAIDLKRYNVISMVCYLGMGWGITALSKVTWLGLGLGGMILLYTGGIAYTAGAVFYMIGSKHRYMHSVFHLFVILGSVLQFLCIFFYVI